MLVLTRKTGQKLIINDNIEVIILETKGDAVKIGIKAPKNVTIYREEIYEEIKKANQQSSRNILIADLDIAHNLFENKKSSVNNEYLSKFQSIINKTKKNKTTDEQ
ncbi:MAG: carbon storage regulator CsrA [bacterium]